MAYRDRIAKHKHIEPCKHGHKSKSLLYPDSPKKRFRQGKNLLRKIEKAVKAFSIWQAERKKKMQKYYDWNNDKVITIKDVKACYEEFADKKTLATLRRPQKAISKTKEKRIKKCLQKRA